LSPRLKAVADLIPASECVADVGTDHALLPIYLIERSAAVRAIAVEKSPGPAAAARRAVAAAGLEDRIEVRLGDGLDTVAAGEAEVIVIAGLGGETVAAIIAKGSAPARAAKLAVLQPMSRAAYLRRWLVEHGWRIEAETLAAEKGRLYQVIAAVPGEGQQLTWLEEEVGPRILAGGHPLLERMLGTLLRRYQREIAGVLRSPGTRAKARRQELAQRIEQLEALLRR
jgi:tRNA (adenine22-N1)-methyltransferase